MDLINKIKDSKIGGSVKAVRLIGKGSFSNCFLVETENKKYVLKVRNDDKYNRLEREYKLLSHQILVKNDLAPRVFAYDKSEKVLPFPFLLEEFVLGKNPNKKRIDHFFIRMMAKWYRKLHVIKTKKLEKVEIKRINSIYFWINDSLKNSKICFENNDLRNEYEKFFSKVLKIAHENDHILKRTKYNFIQCDPSEGNIFISDNKIKLIDWDFAGFHIYERDLALFIDCYDLDKKMEKYFLKSYGLKCTKKFMKRFNVLKLVLIAMDVNWLFSQKKLNLTKLKGKYRKGFELINSLERDKMEK